MIKEIPAYLIPQPRKHTYRGLSNPNVNLIKDLSVETDTFGSLIEEDFFRKYFALDPQYCGIPDYHQLIRERIALARAIGAYGYNLLTYTDNNQWKQEAEEMGIIVVEGFGVTENIPILSAVHILAIPFKTVSGKSAIICSPKVCRVPEWSYMKAQFQTMIELPHPENLVPHEIVPSPLGNKGLSVLTNWTDYAFGVFEDKYGKPHLFINGCAKEVARIKSKLDEYEEYKLSLARHVAGIHELPLSEWRSVPVNGLDFGDKGILIGHAPKSASIMNQELGRPVSPLDVFLEHNRIGGNAGPRCIAVPFYSWDKKVMDFLGRYYHEESGWVNDEDSEIHLREFVRDHCRVLWNIREHYRFVSLRQT